MADVEEVEMKRSLTLTGVTVNAMALRKHHAVLYLRRRLQAIRDEFLGE